MKEDTDIIIQETTESSLIHMPSIDAISVLAERKSIVKDIIDRFFEYGKHYGPAFPNAKTNSLHKLGAEWLGAAFRFVPDYEIVRRVINPQRGELEVTYEVRCDLYRMFGSERQFAGSSIGVCTSEEEKYKYRNAKYVCPNCGKETIIRSRYPEDLPKEQRGWYCLPSGGGCGAQYDVDDPAITDQKRGKVINEDILSLQHTILAMSEKRAYVLAIRAATGVSTYFDENVADDDAQQQTQPGNGSNAPARQNTPPARQTPSPQPTAPMDENITDFARHSCPWASMSDDGEIVYWKHAGQSWQTFIGRQRKWNAALFAKLDELGITEETLYKWLNVDHLKKWKSNEWGHTPLHLWYEVCHNYIKEMNEL